MRRILLLAVCLAVGAATATAQTDYYAEEYIKSGNPRLSSKMWVSHSGGAYKSRRETYDPGMGIPVSADEIPIVTISRMEGDSVKIHSLDRKDKTYSTMAFAVPRGGRLGDVSVNGVSTAEMMDRMGLTPDPLKKEFLGLEDVNGYECHHYRHTSDDGYREDWIYEPLGIVIQRMEGSSVFVLNTIQPGPQPESLFELPADYKPRSVDMSGLNFILDLMQGKGEAGEMMQQGAQELQQQQQQLRQSTEGMTEQEKIIEALKMLGGGNI